MTTDELLRVPQCPNLKADFLTFTGNFALKLPALAWGCIMLCLCFPIGCKKDDPIKEKPPCEMPATESSSLEGVWATQESSEIKLPSIGFVHQNALVVSRSLGVDAVLMALDLKTGNLIWEKVMQKGPLANMKAARGKVFYPAPALGESFYFDLNTLSEHSVFKIPGEGYLDHHFAVFGNLVANITRGVDLGTDSATVRIYVSDIQSKQSKQVYERHYGVNFATNDEAIPEIGFALGATGDTLLCFIQASGLYQSGPGGTGYWYHYQSLNLRNSQYNSGPAFQESSLYGGSKGRMVIHQDRVYYSTETEIHRLDAASGAVDWKVAGRSGALLAYVNDKLLAFESDSYRSLDPQSGAKIWSGHFFSPEQVYNTESLTFDEDHLYVVIADKILKIDLKHGCVVGRYANPYTTDAFFNQAVIGPDGKTLYVGTLTQHFGFKKP